MKKFLLTPLALFFYCGGFNSVYAATLQEQDEGEEFNAAFLFGGENINLERFRYRNAVLPGHYPAEIYLNQKKVGQQTLTFVEKDNSKAELCLNRAILDSLDIKSEAIEQKPVKDQCLTASKVIPQAKFEFDTANQQLNITLPQELTIVRPRGYISPSRWENGVPTIFTQYRFNHYQTKQRDNKRESYSYIGLRSGATLNGWTLRHQGSYIDRSKNNQYKSYSTYLQHDIDRLEGRLTLGDFYTHGRVAESLGLRGVAITSDPNMRPGSQQGFAPTVKGVANSNAKVTIYQNNHIIYETTVPPGPFSIDDLYPSGYSGDLEVEITEDNGSVRRFSVPFVNGFGLVRQGQLWYEFAVGRYRESSRVYPINLFQTSLQYGLSNSVTLNLGTTLAKEYYTGELGFIFENKLGSFETSANISRLQHTAQGKSLKFTYSKNFLDSQTYVYATAEHFFAPQYHLNSAALNYSQQRSNHYLSDFSIKEKYRLSLNQRLGKYLGSLYLTGSANRYKSNKRFYYDYQIAYSNSYKKIDFQIGLWREKRQQQTNHQIYANFSIPFSVGSSHNYLRSAYSQNKQHQYLAQTSLYGTAGEYNQFSYGSTFSKQKSYSSYALNAGYQLPYFSLYATHSQSKDIHQQSYEASGAIVAHPYGITLSTTLGDTFGIIHAKGATNARIKNQSLHKLDLFGNGIVPYLSPYRINSIGVEIDEIPDNVELSATAKEVIPRANTANLVKLTTHIGEIASFDVHLSNNRTLPMGTEAFDSKGNGIGYVGQGSRLFIRSSQSDGKVTLIWGSNKSEQCQLQYELTDLENLSSVLCKTK